MIKAPWQLMHRPTFYNTNMSRTSPKCIVKRKKMEKGKISECPVIKFTTKFSSVKRISFILKKDGHIVYFYITQQRMEYEKSPRLLKEAEKSVKHWILWEKRKKWQWQKALNDVQNKNKLTFLITVCFNMVWRWPVTGVNFNVIPRKWFKPPFIT